MEQILQYLIGSIFMSIYFVHSGKLLFKDVFDKSLKNFIIMLFLIIFIIVNYMILDNIIKTATLYLMVLIIYRLIYNRSVLQCAMVSFVSYLGIALGEVSFIAVLSLIKLLGISINVTLLSGMAVTNIIILFFATLFILIVCKPISNLLKKIKEYNKITLIATFTLLLTTICTLFYKLYFHKYKVDNYLLFNLVLVLALAYIAFIIIKQQYDKSKLSDEYEKYVNYSKHSEKLVDQYSISQHENKNELIIIKSMVHKNNKELLEYLDEIISSKDNIDEAWIRYLRYLPFGGLKGIIHNKISEMKDNGINVFLNISKEIENSKLKDLNIKHNNQLSKILGVFLDNAREAALLSEDKEVAVSVYMEADVVIFEISNTYINDVDLSKIYNVGNTSKGKGRGYGLALVESLLKENKIFKNDVKKIDNYFVQILKIQI